MGFLWQLRLGQLLSIWLGSTALHVTAAVEVDIGRREMAAVGSDGMPCDVKFSECWMDTLRSGEAGLCDSAVDYYKWRGSGYGSNMNLLVATWVSAVMAGRNEIAVILPGELSGIRCLSRSGAREVSGWECIFAPMAGLCIFRSDQEWQEFTTSRNVSDHDRKGAIIDIDDARAGSKAANETLVAAGMGMDGIRASAAVLNYLHSNFQPWLREDIDYILAEDAIAALRRKTFVAMHIRRGDKIVQEAAAVQTKLYVEKAASAVLQSDAEGAGLDAITGVWVSTDDASAASEVEALAPLSFPNVRSEDVLSISHRQSLDSSRRGRIIDELITRSSGMTYSAIAVLFTELTMLAEAEVFVGTFSSNIGRYRHLRREANKHPRDTTKSLDIEAWFPGHLHGHGNHWHQDEIGDSLHLRK